MNDRVGLQFGDFTLDVSERLLFRDGRPVLLTPKAFDVLLVLLENRNNLVEKTRLLQAVWPDVHVDEAVLTRAISDLRKALATATPKARALWSDITPNARRDWIHWITSPKQAETRARRIKNACSMLDAGKRRVCCFDRSGFYSKSLSAPKAAT